MSDIEEPPTKVSKYEMSQTFTQEEADNGQEEWLSDGLLTEEEYNPANEQEDAQSDSALGNTSQNSNSQDNTNVSQEQDESSKVDDSKIEETLNSLENEQPGSPIARTRPCIIRRSVPQRASNNELPPELNTFLVRKTEPKPAEDDEADRSVRDDDSDGNDTDDLLRMLEDDDRTRKNKKGRKEKLQPKTTSEDEDDLVFKSRSAQKLRVAKSVLRRANPARAEPEDSTDEESSRDARTMKKMFTGKRQTAAKSTSKPQKPIPVKVHSAAGMRKTIEKRPPSGKRKPHPKNRLKPITTQIKEVVQPSPKPVQPVVQHAKPVAQSTPAPKRTQHVVKQVVRHVHKDKIVQKTVDSIVPAKVEPKSERPEPDEIIDEAEFLDEDEFDLNEDFAAESDAELDRRAVKQRIMRPEQLDEDMLSDGVSQSEDEFYDEFPSSDSDELDDWFTLDVRNERAGDYLPLLGAKAYELLLEEKQRVSVRLATLRESVAGLAGDGRRLADSMKGATERLAEINDLLKSS